MRSFPLFSQLNNIYFGSVYAADFIIRGASGQSVPLRLLIDTASEGVVLNARKVGDKDLPQILGGTPLGACARNFTSNNVGGARYQADLIVPFIELDHPPQDAPGATHQHGAGTVTDVSVCVLSEDEHIFRRADGCHADGLIGLGPKTENGELSGVFAKMAQDLGISNRFSISVRRSAIDNAMPANNLGWLGLGGPTPAARIPIHGTQRRVPLKMTIRPDKPWYLVQATQLEIGATPFSSSVTIPLPDAGPGVTNGNNAVVDAGNQTVVLPKSVYPQFWTALSHIGTTNLITSDAAGLWAKIRLGDGAYMSNQALSDDNSAPTQSLNWDAWPTLTFQFVSETLANGEEQRVNVTLPPQTYWQSGLSISANGCEDTETSPSAAAAANRSVFRLQQRHASELAQQTNLGLPFIANSGSVVFDRDNKMIYV